jgi:glycerol-3-phosphate dehydrogenase
MSRREERMTGSQFSLDRNRPILILGAGINGISVARELLLNGVSVVVADTADVAFGATSKSSRLIHGGLRYLEYGDFGLVRESLLERERMLRLAPQFVRPLRLHIPVRQRLGGLLASGLRFVGLQKWPGFSQIAGWSGAGPRGLVTVESGLRFYDMLSGESSLPPRSTADVGAGTPDVDPAKYSWVCSYSDCQMLYPERYVLALIADCRRIAEEINSRFELCTYHRVRLDGEVAHLSSVLPGRSHEFEVRPLSVVNATGAWGDLTLKGLSVESPRLFGGTKGSHIISGHRALLEALKGDAIYAEASDGRLVFILPHGPDAVMIGTTDDRFEGRPEEAAATREDVEYLVRMTNEVFPQVNLTSGDVAAHCCGVRPLPYVSSGKTSSIPRGHWVETVRAGNLDIDTLIGGKLTTCRALGEEVARRVLERLGGTFTPRTQDRLVPGAERFPTTTAEQQAWVRETSASSGWADSTVSAMLALIGTGARDLLKQVGQESDRSLVTDTPFPRAVARWMIRNESVRTLSDLIERRLMLALNPDATRGTVEDLARIWKEATGEDALLPVLERLRAFYGRSF